MLSEPQPTVSSLHYCGSVQAMRVPILRVGILIQWTDSRVSPCLSQSDSLTVWTVWTVWLH